uniref:Protein arginine methyltransferase 9 n=1 Tax=Sinocyclocheilus anshuiensis TaxID=1608454 RepID=A0A671KPF9_9TELE
MPNATIRPKRTRRNELVSRSLESAQQCLFSQDYGTAFVHYLLALNLAPALKDFESFRFTLFKWADELDSLGRIQDLFDCYEQALELFPVDEVIVNSMGEHLFRMGFRDEAAGHFYKALKLRPDFPEAKENFYRVANWLVECWHFLMLSDNGRNHKYQLAIKKAVEGGCSSVLGIGTGTGIMCAKMAGAAEVYACELSKTMYELACEVLSANGMADSIKILHLKSLDMEIPKDIPNSREIRRHHRLCASSVGGLDLSAVGHIYSPVRCLADTEDSTEPYTTERLSRLRGGYIQLTQPFTALDIDFNNVQELEGLCSREVTQLRLCVTQEGVLDALAVWFQLHLDQVNHLSTGPQEDTCWEQAIYPIHNTVKCGDEILAEVSCKDSYLRLCCTAIIRDGHWTHNVTNGPPKILTANPEAELCSALAGLQTNQEISSCAFMLESSEMALLNNTVYHNSFQKAMSKLLVSLKSTRSEDKQINPGLVQAYSSVEKEHHQTMFRLLAKGNGMLESALKFWLSHVEDDSAAIILDCIETCGLIRQKLMEKATLARCLLEDGGHIFPERIVIHRMLVESDTLLQESAVQGTELTLEFSIAPFINQFTVPVHMFYKCTHLSEPVELFALDLMNSTANYTDKEVRVQVSTSGKVTAILFWYQIHLDSELSVSTFEDSHWKQAAVVIQQPLTVSRGERVKLRIQFHKSSISITQKYSKILNTHLHVKFNDS